MFSYALFYSATLLLRVLHDCQRFLLESWILEVNVLTEGLSVIKRIISNLPPLLQSQTLCLYMERKRNSKSLTPHPIYSTHCPKPVWDTTTRAANLFTSLTETTTAALQLVAPNSFLFMSPMAAEGRLWAQDLQPHSGEIICLVSGIFQFPLTSSSTLMPRLCPLEASAAQVLSVSSSQEN